MDVFDFSTFSTLTTERLVLRDLVLSDAADLLVFRGDPEVQKYNSVPMKEVSEARELIEFLKDGYTAQSRIIWGISLREQDKVIGMCGFNYWDRYHNRADIGYDLARAYWGQGIASQALRAMLRFGFENMNLHRIEAETIIDNFESVRLLKRLGFQREGVRREYSWEDDGTYHASTIYGLLKHEFST